VTVLTHQALFSGNRRLHGASAFLVWLPSGNIALATARHLVGEEGGVEPALEPGAIDEARERWVAFPRTRRTESVEVRNALFDGATKASDWLVLALAPGAGRKLPTTVLELRATPVATGEHVYLLGCPYAESTCVQNVYRGVVLDRRDTLFAYSLDPPVDLRGFSGAPIVDVAGHVVGVHHGSFESKRVDGEDTTGAGEDASELVPYLKGA
jgi:hypothetical protein